MQYGDAHTRANKACVLIQSDPPHQAVCSLLPVFGHPPLYVFRMECIQQCFGSVWCVPLRSPRVQSPVSPRSVAPPAASAKLECSRKGGPASDLRRCATRTARCVQPCVGWCREEEAAALNHGAKASLAALPPCHLVSCAEATPDGCRDVRVREGERKKRKKKRRKKRKSFPAKGHVPIIFFLLQMPLGNIASLGWAVVRYGRCAASGWNTGSAPRGCSGKRAGRLLAPSTGAARAALLPPCFSGTAKLLSPSVPRRN